MLNKNFPFDLQLPVRFQMTTNSSQRAITLTKQATITLTLEKLNCFFRGLTKVDGLKKRFYLPEF